MLVADEDDLQGRKVRKDPMNTMTGDQFRKYSAGRLTKQYVTPLEGGLSAE